MKRLLAYILIIAAVLYVVVCRTTIERASAQVTNWVASQAFVDSVNARLPPSIPNGGCISCSLQTDAITGTSELWGAGAGGGGGSGSALSTVNGVLNVKDPQFHAKGDCTTDDTTSIQSAINAACTFTNPLPVYLPPASSPNCYYITAPLQLNCKGLKVFGAGPSQSVMAKGFDGPTFLIQNTTSWTPPFLSSITATWQSNHVYAQYAEIKDSNGNIEAATTGGTSTNGVHPTWATTQGGTTTDNTVTWTLESVGTKLLTGSGSAYDGLQYVNAFSQLGIPLDWSEASTATSLNGRTAFTIEATVVAMTNAGGSDSVIAGSQMQPPFPGSANGGFYGVNTAFLLGIATATTKPKFFITTTVGGVHTLTAPSNMSLGVSHHIAGSYDGTTQRLFVDGVLVASNAVTGTMVQTTGEAVCGPCTGFSTFPIGAVDSIRMSFVARYTAGFTPPTAKFTTDSNTMTLFNFITSAVPGTQQGQDFAAPTGTMFIPQEAYANCGSCQVGGVYLGDLDIDSNLHNGGGPGIWAAWAYNSVYNNLRDDGPGFGTDVDVDLHDNDFQSRIDHLFLPAAGAEFSGSEFGIALNFGNQCSGCTVSDAQVDGHAQIALFSNSEGAAINFKVTDRGTLVYPFVVSGAFTLESAFIDSEGASSNLTCDVYSTYGAFAPDTIIGGELDMGTVASGAAYLCVNVGQPIIAVGTSFGGNGATALLNVISVPTQPVVVRDAKFGAIARTNANNGQYLSIQQNGKLEQSTVANLWTCGAVNTGAAVDVTDCDTCTYGRTCLGSGATPYCREECNGSAWIGQ